MSQAIEEIDAYLSDKKWDKAATRIRDAFMENDLESSVKQRMAYNLILSYIRLKDPGQSQAMLNKFSFLLDAGEVREFQEAIYRLPTLIKSNEVKGIGWFRSEISMADIIGLDKVKKQITERILTPMRNPNAFEGFTLKQGDGFVFYGPPGTGKTLLAQAISKEAGMRMLIANVHDMVSKYQGESAKNLHRLFEQAREGGPAIIFIDEIDSLAQSRNSSVISSTGGEDRRIIDALLIELNGAERSNTGLYVIGATNHPWDIDSAFTRSGRFNSFIYIPPPNLKERMNLFKYYIGKLKAEKIDYLKLGLLTFAMSPADISAICNLGGNHAKNLMLSGKVKDRLLKTKDFVWAIKQTNQSSLLKEYDLALERLKEMPENERNQYKGLVKDIKFFHNNGRGRQTLCALFGMIL